MKAPMDRAISIGVLASRSGTNPPTIRYYEEIGLIRPADRGSNGRRTYGEADLKRLTFIRRCRQFGFPIEQVRGLVDLLDNADRSCLDARDLARDQLIAVRGKLDELRALETSLASLVLDCEAVCAGGPGPECVILEDLTTMKTRGCRG